MDKVYDIWIEGYVSQGYSNNAQFIARCSAENFRQACINFSKTKIAEGYGNFDEENLRFWGCRLFDNEIDARKSFG